MWCLFSNIFRDYQLRNVPYTIPVVKEIRKQDPSQLDILSSQ